jgi:hypothetical protein
MLDRLKRDGEAINGLQLRHYALEQLPHGVEWRDGCQHNFL